MSKSSLLIIIIDIPSGEGQVAAQCVEPLTVACHAVQQSISIIPRLFWDQACEWFTNYDLHIIDLRRGCLVELSSIFLCPLDWVFDTESVEIPLSDLGNEGIGVRANLKAQAGQRQNRDTKRYYYFT